MNKQRWGLLPEQVREHIKRREWDNIAALKARLLGTKPFPLRVGLKPPSGRAALADLAHLQTFVNAWKVFSEQDCVQWSEQHWRDLSVQRIPTAVVIDSMQSLIRFLGDAALARSTQWENRMQPLLQVDQRFYPALVSHIDKVEQLSEQDAILLAQLVPQLKPGIADGQYLRALPLIGVDTKFVEMHQTLITALVDTIYQGAVIAAGGLTAWLGCTTQPKGWLTIRPLCTASKTALGNMPILQLPGEVLQHYTLPVANILVVENLQSGLALPAMHNTIAVMGVGKNIAWMDAAWLQNKRVGYWGDIDSWGFAILSDVRDRLVSVEPIMMDIETLRAHEDRMVVEPTPHKHCPQSLTQDEADIFNGLITGQFKASRLEQERISADYIRERMDDWLKGASKNEVTAHPL